MLVFLGKTHDSELPIATAKAVKALWLLLSIFSKVFLFLNQKKRSPLLLSLVHKFG